MTIRKAVIAVAGYGTRFLPATKALPKEMIPILDRPAVQYLVEEAVASGVEDVVLVTRSGAGIFADHFDSSPALETHLREQEKADDLRVVQAIPKLANFAFIRQPRHLPYGNGSPLLAAASYIGRDEPFVFMFGDDLVLSERPGVLQLVEAFEAHESAGAVAVQEVPWEDVESYGIVELREGSDPPAMKSIVEKPDRQDAPSNLAQFGRFVFTPRIIELLHARVDEGRLGKDGELYLADAVADLCSESRVLVKRIEGAWHTTGDPLTFLKTSVAYALTHPDYSRPLREFLRTLNLDSH